MNCCLKQMGLACAGRTPEPDDRSGLDSGSLRQRMNRRRVSAREKCLHYGEVGETDLQGQLLHRRHRVSGHANVHQKQMPCCSTAGRSRVR